MEARQDLREPSHAARDARPLSVLIVCASKQISIPDSGLKEAATKLRRAIGRDKDFRGLAIDDDDLTAGGLPLSVNIHLTAGERWIALKQHADRPFSSAKHPCTGEPKTACIFGRDCNRGRV